LIKFTNAIKKMLNNWLVVVVRAHIQRLVQTF